MIIPFPGNNDAAPTASGEAAAGDCSLLAEALELTRHMLALAEVGDWEGVAECEGLRRDGLNRCFEVAQTPENGELIAEALAVILHLNDELLQHLRVARTQVMAAGSEQQRVRHALDSYAANASRRPPR